MWVSGSALPTCGACSNLSAGDKRREKGDDGHVLEGFPFWGKLVHALGQTGDVGKGMKGRGCCQARGIEKPRDLHRLHCAPLLWQQAPRDVPWPWATSGKPLPGCLSKCFMSTETRLQGRYSETLFRKLTELKYIVQTELVLGIRQKCGVSNLFIWNYDGIDYFITRLCRYKCLAKVKSAEIEDKKSREIWGRETGAVLL